MIDVIMGQTFFVIFVFLNMLFTVKCYVFICNINLLYEMVMTALILKRDKVSLLHTHYWCVSLSYNLLFR